MSTTVTPTFSFSIWRSEPRPDTASHWNPESDPKRTSGRELADRLRAKRRAAEEWEDKYQRNIRPPRLRPPSQQNPVAGSGSSQQATLATSGPDTCQQSEQTGLGLNPDPYCWAAMWWVLGASIYAKQPKHFIWYVGATIVVAVLTRPQYLLFSALFIGLGYTLFHKYLPI